jgi:hypothetical protein
MPFYIQNTSLYFPDKKTATINNSTEWFENQPALGVTNS